MAVVELLLQKIADPILQEANSLFSVGEKVKWLEAEFKWMQCFLKDADAKQEGDERVKNWVGEVRDVAYDAEYVIDTYLFKVANLRQTVFVGLNERYACILKELIARFEVCSKIKGLEIKIDAISKSRSAYGIENIGQGAGTSSAGRSHQVWRVTFPNVQEPDFVGFEKELEILVARLTEGELRRCVVSVVGMGGLGKTTLTKKLYNADVVKNHFHTHAWISISQEYSVKDLLQVFVRRWMVVSNDVAEKLNIAELRDKISGYLNDKRYLVVLDDIWKTEAWDDLKDAFPDVNNGSRVMLTTRNKDVALYADSDPRREPHELRFLTNEESWDLFGKKIYGGCPQDLEKLGREIVGKCHGLPLAIMVIGGLLARKEHWQWEIIRKNISWQFVEGQPQISKILSLSFRDLPYQLQLCFLYLGVFPEDYEFSAKKLIQLWAAEGFLQQRGDGTLEEMGKECLSELIQRSMIQLVKRSSNGGIKSCRIHDLLRDLSISKAKEGMFLEVHHGNSNTPASRARRLVIHHNDFRESISLNSSTSHFRSALVHNQGSYMLESKQEKLLFKGFKLLRVLDLHNVKIKELSSEIGALILLKYLGCTNTYLTSLPSSIGKLLNLQTLVVTSRRAVDIPREIEKMEQLRHFEVRYPIHEESPYDVWGGIQGRPRLNQMSNLHTLTVVKAGNWMRDCLESLTHLRKLGICLDYGMSDVYDAVLFDSIRKLKFLQSLLIRKSIHNIKFPESSVRPLFSLPTLRKLVLDGKLANLAEPYEFLTNLTKLTLKWSHLEQDPLATLERLENLRVLRLLTYSYVGVEMACTSEGFPRLESLHLERLCFLNEWTVEEGAMPSLLHLRIYDCPGLKKLPEGLQHVKKLELLNMGPAFNG